MSAPGSSSSGKSKRGTRSFMLSATITASAEQAAALAQGISLMKAFRSTTAPPKQATCYQHEGAPAIRKGPWKLVMDKRFPTPAQWELYDIKPTRGR